MRVAHPSRTAAPLAEGAPLLSLEDVRVNYGGIKALKGISLQVFAGEIVAMIGANGAGKSTTLKSIAGLLHLAGGTITFAGEPTKGRATEDLVAAGISLAPEGRAIFPNLTVRENLELGAYLHRHKPTILETIEDVTKLFPRLGERMKQEGGTLSGGEQQMLAVGRALMSRPRLLLMDEPSLGLAPIVVDEIFRIVAELNRDGTTIFLVEQNAHKALQVAHRFYLMEQGRVTFSGTPGQLAEDEVIQRAYLGTRRAAV